MYRLATVARIVLGQEYYAIRLIFTDDKNAEHTITLKRELDEKESNALKLALMRRIPFSWRWDTLPTHAGDFYTFDPIIASLSTSRIKTLK